MKHGPGLIMGIVEATKDPQGLGRVRVLAQGAAQDSLGWLPVRTMGAGPGAGLQAPHHVGDQVVVAKLYGAAEAYVVLGGVWSKAMATPEPNADGANAFCGYRSRSGQRLTFDDSDHAKVTLVAANGTQAVGLGAFAKGGAGDNALELPRNNLVGDHGVALAGQAAVVLRAPNGTIGIAAKEIVLSASQTHTASAKEAAVEGAQTKLAALGALTLGGSSVGAK